MVEGTLLKDLLNPTVTSSAEGAEAENSGQDASITQAEVTKVVRKLFGGRMIEIGPRIPQVYLSRYI